MIGRPATDMTGFSIPGGWTVLGRIEGHYPYEQRAAMWQCRCACGVEKPVAGFSLRKTSQRCGSCATKLRWAQARAAKVN